MELLELKILLIWTQPNRSWKKKIHPNSSTHLKKEKKPNWVNLSDWCFESTPLPEPLMVHKIVYWIEDRPHHKKSYKALIQGANIIFKFKQISTKGNNGSSVKNEDIMRIFHLSKRMGVGLRWLATIKGK